MEAKKDWNPVSGHYQDMPDWGLNEEDFKHWKYQFGTYQGQPAHIMNVYDEQRSLVAQKFRMAGKEFRWQGDGDDLLYGMWLWQRGKHIVITEGEKDAITVSKCFGHKYPVVSLPNGCKSVRKCIKRCYDYLGRFDRIVLMFDMDEPGRAAAEEAAQMLPAGKVCVANLPEKDANEVLIKNGMGPIVSAFWDAKPYRPDGIISWSDLSLDDLMAESNKGYDLKLKKLNTQLLGLRKGEITLFTAGSGIGKSTIVRQICFDLHHDYPELSFGNVYLEENNAQTAKAFIALDNNVPLGLLNHDKTIITPDQWRASFSKFEGSGRMWFYNHFGSLESDRLISKLHYMATVLKVDFIALDHVSIVTSGIESSSEGERKDIDILMTRLAKLVQETGVGILAVAHLKRVKDKVFNEGSEVSLTDLRGSAALEQLSFNVISMERNQQDMDTRDMSLIRVLKCRETGDTGPSDTVKYNRKTGKLEEAAAVGFKEQEGFSATSTGNNQHAF